MGKNTHTKLQTTTKYNFQTVFALFPLGFLRKMRCYICPVIHCVPAPLPPFCTVGGIGMGDRQQPLLLPALCYGPGESRTSDGAPQAALGAASTGTAAGRTFPAQTHPTKRIQPFYKHSPPFPSSSGRRVGGRGHALCVSLPLLLLARKQSTEALAAAFKTDHKKVNLQY